MIELLVDGAAFRRRLERDLPQASSVVLQTMSFEGDAAGEALAGSLLASPASDRRVIVDAYTRYILSGRFRYSPRRLFDRRFRDELEATDGMFGRMRAGGVGVRLCNPAGLLLRRLPARNHKKSVVIDRRIAYVGGINISDHNFEWHDLMLRIEDDAIARVLAEDFDRTWEGRPTRHYGESRGVEVHVLDGRTNEPGFERLFQLLEAARHEIIVHSPHVSFPFCESLARATRRGVNVTVITPVPNPIPSIGRYLRWQGRRAGFDLRVFPRETHLKAMLIDDRWLVVGSSNFDYLSYRRLQEILVVVRDPATIEAFRTRVLAPDLALCVDDPAPSPGASGHALHMALRGAGALAAFLSG